MKFLLIQEAFPLHKHHSMLVVSAVLLPRQGTRPQGTPNAALSSSFPQGNTEVAQSTTCQNEKGGEFSCFYLGYGFDL